MKRVCNYLDIARVISIYAVVLGHFYPFVGLDNLVGRQIIYAFHMPFFFLLSGYLWRSSSLKKLCYSLLLPYILYNAISIIRFDFIP